MRTSWKIFTRDIARLGRTAKAWIIIIGVLITPALYSWVNIKAFWDPYGATANIAVAVVNEDTGARTNVTGPVNVGAQVVRELKDNDQLGWQFLDAREAQRALERGDIYASITIPADFSADLVGMLDGTFHQPQLIYRVNEKISAIGPKITDTGANKLTEQIDASFKEQVAKAATTAVRVEGKDIDARLSSARERSERSLASTVESLGEAEERVAAARATLAGSRDSLQSADAGLEAAAAAVEDARAVLVQVQELTSQAQGMVGDYSAASSSAIVDSTAAVAQGTAQARATAAELSAALGAAGGQVERLHGNANAAVSAGEDTLRQLRGLLDSAALSPAVAAPLRDSLAGIEAATGRSRALVSQIDALAADTQQAARELNAAADAVAAAGQETQALGQSLQDTVGTAVPQLNRTMASLSARAGAFAATLDTRKGQVEDGRELLRGIGKQMEAADGALASFGENLDSLRTSVDATRRDLVTLAAATRPDALSTITGLNSQEIGHFFADPVEVTSEAVYPVGSYGSAMAALFTNLSLWIGAFMLIVIFKVEVDREGFERISVGQAYLGRFLLLALLVVAQAVVVTVGDLVIGVHTVNAPMFVLTGVLIGLAYLSIIYALTSALGHLGRGLAIVLIILQIPGASGLYPIEMMPDFFRALYPLLPFSYGIDALRETIGGFYGLHYLQYLGVLGLMFVLAFIIGLLGRRGLAHFNLLFNRDLARTEFINAERVQIVGDGYRIADVLRALQGPEALAADLERRTHNYRRWIRCAAWLGVAGMVVLGVVAWAVPSQKPLLLGIWTLWCMLLIAVTLLLEYIRQSVAQSTELVHRDQDFLQHSVAARGQGVHIDAGTTADGPSAVDGPSAADGDGAIAADGPSAADGNGVSAADGGSSDKEGAEA
ncbi:YhgE/Pip domain-containing protein [Corynebacterium lizhenjunii]|uniref:YhgE/Pip domain-containing protein n=1 Tax=Corynebacterium lizhenjunii TaxID=2709394 RepID=A0A7T0KEG2_9CORY|nr:YhgE/Pip domain-containing protein [Corynebacterium lizhenjunii]QPK79296.1 YhgE/Pip domain-containing protein [Corynebacterium lizhenjunii]